MLLGHSTDNGETVNNTGLNIQLTCRLKQFLHTEQFCYVRIVYNTQSKKLDYGNLFIDIRKAPSIENRLK